MNLVDRPTIAPAICLICERAHQDGDQPWIDTLAYWDVGVVTFLTGRKYVCDSCAREMAVKMGWLSPEQGAALADTLDDLEAQVSAQEERMKDLEALKRLLDRAAANRLDD